MTELFPSYLMKIHRAKKHLADLQEAVNEYGIARPYGAFRSAEGRKEVWRLRFTSSPENTQIPIIAADLVYNLRSGLDHLAAALVPASFASHVGFSIFWPGVWEPPAPGENEERSKARERWQTYTRKMPSEAVTILQGLQPDEDSKDRIHNLALVNKLSNKDRHMKFPVFASGLADAVATINGQSERTGSVEVANVPQGTRGILMADAEIRFPEQPTQVDIQGVPVVAIHMGQRHRYVAVPDTFDKAIRYIENEVINPLVPYVWTRP